MQTREVPITPEMREMLQTLANTMDAKRREYEAAQAVFNNGIALCQFRMGLPDAMVEGFSISKAAFLVKTNGNAGLDDGAVSTAPLDPTEPKAPEGEHVHTH